MIKIHLQTEWFWANFHDWYSSVQMNLINNRCRVWGRSTVSHGSVVYFIINSDQLVIILIGIIVWLDNTQGVYRRRPGNVYTVYTGFRTSKRGSSKSTSMWFFKWADRGAVGVHRVHTSVMESGTGSVNSDSREINQGK